MPKPEKTYQQLKEQLDRVLDKLQSDELDIEAAEAAYKEGMALIKQMEAKLSSVENKIIKLKTKFD
jgi:exodeoxyribonuclease VII small subunit